MSGPSIVVPLAAYSDLPTRQGSAFRIQDEISRLAELSKTGVAEGVAGGRQGGSPHDLRKIVKDASRRFSRLLRSRHVAYFFLKKCSKTITQKTTKNDVFQLFLQNMLEYMPYFSENKNVKQKTQATD